MKCVVQPFLGKSNLNVVLSQCDQVPKSQGGIKTMRILIVEDEVKTAAYLRKGLSEGGYVVDSAIDGEEGLHLSQTGNYDLVILDVMLPRRDGWSVITE